VTGCDPELLRALGAVADNPRDARFAAEALGVPVPDAAEHTDVFVLNCPPYASIHLGPEGGVGGEGADRVAGFWRAIGLEPPPEPDHLTALFALYARLAEAVSEAERDRSAAALERARAALFREHIWSWVPGYLDAVADLGTSLGAWAEVTRAALEREASLLPGGELLPAALRDAPPPVEDDEGPGPLVDGVLTPIRSGLVITRRSLAVIASQAGTGYRIGERRFALRAMLEQDPAATLSALAAEARRWATRRSQRPGPDAAGRWWAQRSAHTAAALSRAGDANRPTTARAAAR
jgi:hypothetical protein